MFDIFQRSADGQDVISASRHFLFAALQLPSGRC